MAALWMHRTNTKYDAMANTGDQDAGREIGSSAAPDGNPSSAHSQGEAAEGSTNPEIDADVQLLSLIAELEADTELHDEHRIQSRFGELRRSIEEAGAEPSADLVAEEIAFTVYAAGRGGSSSWGLHFGPMMSGLTANGDPWDVPPLSAVTPAVLEYWRQRAQETQHPVLRARYADLLWELPRKLDHARPDAAMARIASDAYLEIVESGRFSHPIAAIAKATRALEIALAISDAARVERARDVLLSLEDRVAVDDKPGLWGFCFDLLVEPPNRKIPVSEGQREALVTDLEARLTRFASAEPYPFHPAAAEAAALRLARYYRRIGKSDDVVRVMRPYGEIVQRMRGTAAPMVMSHSLEQLYEEFKSFGMHEEADALTNLIRETGEESLSEMKPISAEIEVPAEKVEAYFAEMLSGPATEVLQSVAFHFIPSRDHVEAQLRELAEQSPLGFLFNRVIKDEEGRTVARIGPLEEDLEGQFVAHMSQNLQLTIPWLRETFSRALDQGIISEAALSEFVFACPMFLPNRRAVIDAGLAAFVRGESMAAIHLLVPQIEQVLRRLAMALGAPIYTQRRGGGFHARLLDDLLRDEAISEVLGKDMITYLRVLLTDARGWNIRNDVCHGLASVAKLTMPIADRVVHALLALALLREREVVN